MTTNENLSSMLEVSPQVKTQTVTPPGSIQMEHGGIPSQAALAAAEEIRKAWSSPGRLDIAAIIDKHMAPAWIPSDLQVEDYIRSKLADAHKINDYAAVSVGIYASKGNDRHIRCSVDFGTAGSISTSTTLTDAIAKIGDEYSPEKKAAHLRQEAERLNREAEALEQEGAES